jgi:hypothetical protein
MLETVERAATGAARPAVPAPWVIRENDLRVRDPAVRENLAVLRHIALTRLKQDQRSKLGIQNKRLKAGWDERYLDELLFTPPHSTTETGPSGARNISRP